MKNVLKTKFYKWCISLGIVFVLLMATANSPKAKANASNAALLQVAGQLSGVTQASSVLNTGYATTTTQVSNQSQNQNDWLEQLKTFLTNIAHDSKGLPGVGNWLDNVLQGMQADDQWMVGAALLLAIGIVIAVFLS